jgi:NAD(P)-dependent dehydrogenase (short-subunit alcohol dehydrogenase family)
MIAKCLYNDGWIVSLGMRRPERPAWASDATRIHIFAYDAVNTTAPMAWVAEVANRFGRIDALVANAGILIPKSVVDISDDEMDQLIDINVKAPRRLAAACWDMLGESGRGRVILLASLSGKRVKSARSGSYSMTKFAAVGLAHGLRHAGFELGIRATAICPGFVATDMAVASTDLSKDVMTSPHDLARIAAFLIDLPNEASVAEFCVNCQLEESF